LAARNIILDGNAGDRGKESIKKTDNRSHGYFGGILSEKIPTFLTGGAIHPVLGFAVE